MKKINSVSVLGCGWLGFPLAKRLVSLGYEVKGSTTSPNKLNLFSDAGINPYKIQFNDNISAEDKLTDFLQSDVLVIAVPPGRTDEKRAGYRQLFKTLAYLIPDAALKQVILISSTSVYGDHNREVDEETPPKPTEPSGSLMWEVEQLIGHWDVSSLCIRFGGLIGPQRHPGRFFAGKQNIANGLAPVNLIHLEDAVSVIETAIIHQQTGILNACAPSHPARNEFYSLAALKAGLALPTFIAEMQLWKKVKSSRLESLKFIFIYPDLMACLAEIPQLPQNSNLK